MADGGALGEMPPLAAADVSPGPLPALSAPAETPPACLFLSSARTDMLAIRMWGMIGRTFDVRVAGVSGVVILVGLVLMVVLGRLVGETRRMRG
jgi:putative spermidine/putrescine transport system permease protein